MCKAMFREHKNQMAISISFAEEAATEADKTILIVDDEPSVVHLLQDLLLDRYRCLTAFSGPEALRHFETRSDRRGA